MVKRERKKKDMVEPPDSINLLPDELLIMILSNVPIYDAVRNSTLSKRWRFLWKQTLHLDFNVKHMLQNTGKGHLKYSMIFFSILKEQLGDLTSCSFLHFPDDDLNSWIPFLFEKKKGLKDLIIACEPVTAILKQSFPKKFDVWKSFSSLSSLELNCYYLESPSTFEPCKNLKTLKPKDMHVKDETTGEILRSCVSLENLTLFYTFGFRYLQIRNPKLKFLELNVLLSDRIIIFTENLEVLVLVSITCLAKNLLIVAPNIRVFHCFSNREIPIVYPAEVKT